MEDSLFTKIRKGKLPGNIVYQDDLCFAIEDINPQAPIHLLIIPIKEIEKVSDASEEDINLLGHLIHVSKKIAHDHGLNNNYRLIINNGSEAGQTVFHIHVHLLGGGSLDWLPA